MCCVAPRLQLDLLLNGFGEAAQPPVSRERSNNIVSSGIVYNVLDVFDMWVVANIVIDCRKLDHLSQKRDVSICAEVLVPNYGFTHGLGLILRTSRVLKKI